MSDVTIVLYSQSLCPILELKILFSNFQCSENVNFFNICFMLFVSKLTGDVRVQIPGR